MTPERALLREIVGTYAPEQPYCCEVAWMNALDPLMDRARALLAQPQALKLVKEETA